jgi:Protein of unknown function (DUF2690)
MKYRRIAAAALLGAAALVFSPAAAAPAQANSPVVGCAGAVACAGQDPVASSCANDKVLIEDQQVPYVGDIDLYESPSCGTAWASLSGGSCNSQETCGNAQAAEIFYIPPQGGTEQYQAVSWDGNPSTDALSLMVPDTGSVKACGGNPEGGDGMIATAFDLNPQGQQNPEGNRITAITAQNPGEYPSGACTLWH